MKFHHQRLAAKTLGNIFRKAGARIQVGATGRQIESWCEQQLSADYGAASLKGYKGFPANICINRNTQAAHCPPNDQPFEPGDVITLDIVIDRMGWKADLAWTYAIPPLSEQRMKLLQVAWQASLLPLCVDIAQEKRQTAGKQSAELLQHLLKQNGFSLCKGFVGHSIGRDIHEEPLVPYQPEVCVFPGQNKPEEEKVFCWEPVITTGNGVVRQEPDGSYFTVDNQPAAQFEHMFLIDSTEIQILNIAKKEIQSGKLFHSRPPW